MHYTGLRSLHDTNIITACFPVSTYEVTILRSLRSIQRNNRSEYMFSPHYVDITTLSLAIHDIQYRMSCMYVREEEVKEMKLQIHLAYLILLFCRKRL